MLMPKKVKFRKQQKGKRRGKAWRGSSLSFGEYGLKVLECGYITDRQIEASRYRSWTRFIKRGGKIWGCACSRTKPITKKPGRSPHGGRQGRAESLGRRSAAGQDPRSRWKGGSGGCAAEAMRLASNKLPLKTKFVMRPGAEKDSGRGEVSVNLRSQKRDLGHQCLKVDALRIPKKGIVGAGERSKDGTRKDFAI